MDPRVFTTAGTGLAVEHVTSPGSARRWRARPAERTDFPIAENSRRRDGLTLDELQTVLAGLVGAPGWRGLTLCEVNPDHAPDEATSFARLVDVLAEVFRVP